MDSTTRKRWCGSMATYKETVDALDSSIASHVKTNRSKSSLVTGWILIASVSDVEDGDNDGYITQSSHSLPHHTQLGLLNMALDDKRNVGMIATLRAFMDDE
jgi:hypothetical protein